jgi:AraC family transcriptional activator of pobA
MVAYELDYCDPGYFNRVFKKIEGVTPAEYRKMHQ